MPEQPRLSEKIVDAQLAVVDPSKKNELLEAEKSADPLDRELETRDPRSYFYNKKARAKYKQFREAQFRARPTMINIDPMLLLQGGAGAIVNKGDGRLLAIDNAVIDGVRIRKGDKLECINENQIMNRSAMRDQRMQAMYAEQYELESARDAYRRPNGLVDTSGPVSTPFEPVAPSYNFDAQVIGYKRPREPPKTRASFFDTE